MTTPTKTPTILERLTATEQTVQGLANYVQKELSGIKAAFQNVIEVVNAAIKAQGPEFEAKVQATVLAEQNARSLEKIDREKAMIGELLSTGAIKVVDVVGENSVVVGREFNPAGEAIGLGYVQVRANQFTPEAKAQVLGQGVGFVIDLPTGKFEVLEVYETVPADQQPKPATDAEAPAAQ